LKCIEPFQHDPPVTSCTFHTVSEHSTSMGRVRYQGCACGRFRVLLAWEVLAEAPQPPCGLSLPEQSPPAALPSLHAGHPGVRR
jgi:hypothetical protein